MFFNKREWIGYTEDKIIKDKDLIKFNQKINGKKLDYLVFKQKNLEIKVDLNKNEIFVNKKKVMCFEEGEKTELLNFRRKQIHIVVGKENNRKEDIMGYGIGLINKEGKKKFILVRNNKYELKEE